MVPVATRLFSDDQLDQLRSFPDIGKDDLIRYFTLTGADVAFVDPGRGRVQVIGLGLPSSCARCRGWGSCLTR
jgi:Domain of unknown function (DUF4158)